MLSSARARKFLAVLPSATTSRSGPIPSCSRTFAANSTVIGVPARVIKTQGERLPDATMDHINLPDPISDRFLALEQELIELRKKLENRDDSPPR